MVYEDGLEFEKMYQKEVEQFECVKAGGSICGDAVDAAIILRDAGKLAALRMLRDGVIAIANEEVDLDVNTVDDLIFTVV
jgi:hypothetical protein